MKLWQQYSIFSLGNIDESRLDGLMNISLNNNETATFDDTIMERVGIERLYTGRGISDIGAAIILTQASIDGEERQHWIGANQSVIHSRGRPDELSRLSLPDIYKGAKRIFSLDNYM